jgi:ubiquinone/menaquinone biosynthesis C-methylase UbiE
MEEYEVKWLSGDGAEMVRSLGVKESDCVVDFGCGKGRYTIPAVQVVGKKGMVFAVERHADELDIFNERLEKFSVNKSVKILNTEDLHLDFTSDKSVNVLFAFDVLQYVEDYETLFKSVKRVLSPNGLLIIYPAGVPHPGDVDMDLITKIIEKNGMKLHSQKEYKMMHNKFMVDDIIYTFKFDSSN